MVLLHEGKVQKNSVEWAWNSLTVYVVFSAFRYVSETVRCWWCVSTLIKESHFGELIFSDLAAVLLASPHFHCLLRPRFLARFLLLSHPFSAGMPMTESPRPPFSLFIFNFLLLSYSINGTLAFKTCPNFAVLVGVPFGMSPCVLCLHQQAILSPLPSRTRIPVLPDPPRSPNAVYPAKSRCRCP